MTRMTFLDTVRWNAQGIVPAIAQDATSGRVLTLAWMNADALERTVISGQAHYWSRSRKKLWRKGETSGHVQSVREIRLDCDSDAVLLIVDQAGGIACHTGRERCFFRRLENDVWRDVEPVLKDPAAIYGAPDRQSGEQPRQPDAQQDGRTPEILAQIAATIESRRNASADTSYVASLFARGDDAILKKIGEEATETMMAAKDGDAAAITHEVADLWFHCLVLLARHGLGPADVLRELGRRHGTSGLAEKAARSQGR
ncbi:MAG TPA: bifunctional phosphoribosyl-AMP cyclohydrolase/phosphoribosyl-ATP diphosphatase HisIE [Casimicrobiaceae bacterium]|nr:bifunctional phosphoribosyl-AMP cyclohydrolase/phosphoribosyl-ATP diphosphatase HisIE [Casimicrobiaceae bacterium]